ncbi:hypothetical protein BTH41_02883 [Bacillus mycoides]|nr:hypothetical protein BTH41_02883 [Bacillus mycoides]
MVLRNHLTTLLLHKNNKTKKSALTRELIFLFLYKNDPFREGNSNNKEI